MIIYKSDKCGFLSDVSNHRIADILDLSIRSKLHHTTRPNEIRSWEHSLMEMKNVLDGCEVPDDCGVAVEYNIPLSGNRVDVVLSGYDSGNEAYMVVIELKQWQSVETVPGSDGVVRTYINCKIREKTHPSYQAWSYAVMLSSYNEYVQSKPVHMSPCAYLHNYRRHESNDPLFMEQYSDCLTAAPAFTREDVESLRSFICKYIVKGDRNCSLIVDVDNGKIRPAKSLQDSIAGMLRGNAEFSLIESQKVAHDKIISESRAAQKDAKKHVVIVKGGPGTGKSVIAIMAMAKLTQSPDSQFVQYISKNSAPRNVYKTMLKGTKKIRDVDLMFQGPDNFYLRPENMLGTVLVDEAHRLRMHSGQFCNKGECQIREIIKAAKCSVFFVDDHQRVTVKDCCTATEIETEAAKIGAVLSEVELDSQFRCNGSDGYIGWIDNSLEVRQTANRSLGGVNYDFRIFDDPSDMFNAIVSKNGNNKARVVAGYCWEWRSDKKDDPSYCDIQIGGFGMSWNLGNTDTWAIDASSINQAGCIHTCQGLEFEYVGVIIGEDLRYENGRLVTDWRKRARTDSSIKGAKGITGLTTLAKTDPSKADAIGREIIINTYRTLMTRGMKGCYVYCCDKALAEYLKRMAGLSVERHEPEILHEVGEALKFREYLPLYSMRAACGHFGGVERVESPVGWVKISGRNRLGKNLYVVRAQGHSMEPRIKDGEFCIFEYRGNAMPQDNDIVLAEHTGEIDDETHGAYSIKKFVRAGEEIILHPINPDYTDIVLDQTRDYRIVGVLRRDNQVVLS